MRWPRPPAFRERGVRGATLPVIELTSLRSSCTDLPLPRLAARSAAAAAFGAALLRAAMAAPIPDEMPLLHKQIAQTE